MIDLLTFSDWIGQSRDARIAPRAASLQRTFSKFREAAAALDARFESSARLSDDAVEFFDAAVVAFRDVVSHLDATRSEEEVEIVAELETFLARWDERGVRADG